MSKIFISLKKGLEKALAYTEGRLTLKTEFIEIPKPPNESKAEDIIA